jgi:hypothetical protein
MKVEETSEDEFLVPTIEIEDDFSQKSMASFDSEHQDFRKRSHTKFVTDHHHVGDSNETRIFGCTYGRLWFSLVFIFFFLITFLPILYTVISIDTNIYNTQQIPMFLIILDCFICIMLGVVWSLCIGKLKRKEHEHSDYFETILFSLKFKFKKK